MTASHGSGGRAENAGADWIFTRRHLFPCTRLASHRRAHDLARGKPPPPPDDMSALARTTASALRAPRLAGALRCGKRYAAIDSRRRRPRRWAFLRRRENISRSGSGARCVDGSTHRARSYRAREVARRARTRASYLFRRAGFSASSLRGTRHGSNLPHDAPRGFSVRWATRMRLFAKRRDFFSWLDVSRRETSADSDRARPTSRRDSRAMVLFSSKRVRIGAPRLASPRASAPPPRQRPWRR